MGKYERTDAPAMIKTASLERLLDLWEATIPEDCTVEIATTRGWIMDELEARNPDGFNAWLDTERTDDLELRKFICKAG